MNDEKSAFQTIKKIYYFDFLGGVLFFLVGFGGLITSVVLIFPPFGISISEFVNIIIFTSILIIIGLLELKSGFLLKNHHYKGISFNIILGFLYVGIIIYGILNLLITMVIQQGLSLYLLPYVILIILVPLLILTLYLQNKLCQNKSLFKKVLAERA